MERPRQRPDARGVRHVGVRQGGAHKVSRVRGGVTALVVLFKLRSPSKTEKQEGGMNDESTVLARGCVFCLQQASKVKESVSSPM